MPSQLKDHGEVKFKDDQAGVEDTVIGESEGVRIYHRKSRTGRRRSTGRTRIGDRSSGSPSGCTRTGTP